MESLCAGGCIAFATSTAFEPFPVEGFETGFFSCGSIFREIWNGSREIDEKFSSRRAVRDFHCTEWQGDFLAKLQSPVSFADG